VFVVFEGLGGCMDGEVWWGGMMGRYGGEVWWGGMRRMGVEDGCGIEVLI